MPVMSNAQDNAAAAAEDGGRANWGKLRKAVVSETADESECTGRDRFTRRTSIALYNNMRLRVFKEDSYKNRRRSRTNLLDHGFTVGLIAIGSRAFLPLFGRDHHLFFWRHFVMAYFALFCYCAKGLDNSNNDRASFVYYLVLFAVQVIVPVGIVYRPGSLSIGSDVLNAAIQIIVPEDIGYQPWKLPIVMDVLNAATLISMLVLDTILRARVRTSRQRRRHSLTKSFLRKVE